MDVLPQWNVAVRIYIASVSSISLSWLVLSINDDLFGDDLALDKILALPLLVFSGSRIRLRATKAS